MVSVKKSILNPNIIVVTDKGKLGELKNKGLAQCTSEFTCFVHDNVVLNPEWFSKCMDYLNKHSEVVAVFGGLTEGAMICRTQRFKDVGGWPKADNYIWNKLSNQIVSVNVNLQHLYPKRLDLIKHTYYWLRRDFQTEMRAGTYHNPVAALKQSLKSARHGYPEIVFTETMWTLKGFFCLPFILEDRKRYKRVKVRLEDYSRS